MKKREGQIKENSKWQSETKKWTEDERESSGDSSEKVRHKKKKKKKVGKIETRSDREKREGEKETG